MAIHRRAQLLTLTLIFGIGIGASLTEALAFAYIGSIRLGAAIAILSAAYFSIAAFLTWRGSPAGPRLAAFLLITLVFSVGVVAVYLTGLSGAMVAFAVMLLAILMALFSETVSDFVSSQFAKRSYEGSWDAIAHPFALGAPADVGVETAETAARAAELARLATRRTRLGRLVELCVLVAIGIALAYLLIEIAQSVSEVTSLQQELDHPTAAEASSNQPADNPDFMSAIGAAVADNLLKPIFTSMFLGLDMVFFPLEVAVGYLQVFVAPFLVALPIGLLFAFRWRRPARILLLRPFNRDQLTRPLVRFLRTNVAGFGHIYTLADTTLRVPAYVRLPFIVGQIGLATFRSQRMRIPSDVLRVCRMMRRRLPRNLNWFFSLSKIFAVASTDQAWQPAVTRLAHEADLILIDLTGARKHVVWELQRCAALHLLDRVIVIAHASDKPEVTALLTQFEPTLDAADSLLLYDGDTSNAGALVTQRIAARLARLEAAGEKTQEPLPGPLRDPARRAQLRNTAVTIALIFPWLLSSFLLEGLEEKPLPPTRTLDTEPLLDDLHLEMRGRTPLLTGRDRNVRSFQTFRVKDLSTGSVQDIHTEEWQTNAARISPDAKWFAYGDPFGTLFVRDFPGTWSVSEPWPGPVERGFNPVIEFNASGTVIAISSEGGVALWNPRSAPLHLLYERGPHDILAFSPDGSRLATADFSGHVEIWDTEAVPQRRGSWSVGRDIKALAWSNDGSRIATAGDRVRFWSPPTGKRLGAVSSFLLRDVRFVEFVPNSAMLFFEDSDGFGLYEPYLTVTRFEDPSDALSRVGVYRDGSKIYGILSEFANGVAVWDISTLATH